MMTWDSVTRLADSPSGRKNFRMRAALTPRFSAESRVSPAGEAAGVPVEAAFPSLASISRQLRLAKFRPSSPMRTCGFFAPSASGPPARLRHAEKIQMPPDVRLQRPGVLLFMGVQCAEEIIPEQICSLVVLAPP